MKSAGNNLSETNLWTPNPFFFRSGNADFFNPFTMSVEKISWKFNSIKQTGLPMTIVRCALEAFGIKTNGYGDGFFIHGSMKQAFAEGWERLWMLFLHKNKMQQFSKITSSNGFAGGKNNDEALISSKNELIERALLIEAWDNKKGWTSYELKGLRSRFLSRFLRTKGWKIRLFLLSDENSGNTLTILTQHRCYGAIFDATYLPCHKPAISAELKLLRSILRAIPRATQNTPDPEWELPINGVPSDHHKFYRISENGKAFDFLENSEAHQGELYLKNPENIVSKIIVPVSSFPAVAMSYHPDWPKLQWGKQSIGGKNPWPHPLA